MISLLHGTLLDTTPSSVIVDVSGVGFELGVSSITAARLPQLGQECLLYTRMQVREDAMTLYGFSDKEERAMFDRLVAITGVGPRLALAILSRYSVGQLYSIVMAEDHKAMALVSGVGKKTAQRLILELKGTFSKDKGFIPSDAPTTGSLSLAETQGASSLDEARAALLSMGFSPQEADLALSGFEDAGMPVEKLLAAALRRLGMDS
ncbi:MAG: Holliday junction branch migration protein RuvA [Collinsella sp.]|nr:Holliday junction branch migration protein RuvA [Collinsella sp.]